MADSSVAPVFEIDFKQWWRNATERYRDWVTGPPCKTWDRNYSCGQWAFTGLEPVLPDPVIRFITHGDKAWRDGHPLVTKGTRWLLSDGTVVCFEGDVWLK